MVVLIYWQRLTQNNCIFLHVQKLSVLYWSLFKFMEVTAVGWLNNCFQQCLFSEVKLYKTILSALGSELTFLWTESLCSVLLSGRQQPTGGFFLI